MNVFFIPSWYPSEDTPLAGIFTKEQATEVAKNYPGCNLGLSLWGQKSESNLLWAKQPLKSLLKLINFMDQEKYENQQKENYTEFYTPALIWTTKLLSGNLNKIVLANEENMKRFEAKAGKISLIHAHVAFPAGLIAMKLSAKYELPYIITEHMSPFPFPSLMKKGKMLNNLANPLEKAQAVISVSPHAANDIRQKTGVKPLCIPNLINEELFKPSPKMAKPATFTFFTLGRMVPQKGIPDLLNAIAILENKDFLFRIGGEGEYKKEYQELATKLNISHRISWLGELTRTEAAKEFQNCHAFVLPSIHESMGVVYAEAIACGKPVIATRCGGPEFIVNEDNGLLADVNDPEQLAKTMDYMIDNYSRYQTDVIRNYFLEHFSSAVITKKIVSVYEAVIANKPLPAELYPDYE